VCPRLDLRYLRRLLLAGFGFRLAADDELGGRQGHGDGAEKAAAVAVDVIECFNLVHEWISSSG